jgi:hypothetical protein
MYVVQNFMDPTDQLKKCDCPITRMENRRMMRVTIIALEIRSTRICPKPLLI